MGCSSCNCEQEEHQACSCLMRAPIPQSLTFLICEMGAGKGWKPRSGGALERGSEEKEAGVRARSSVGDQGSRGWDSGMLGTRVSATLLEFIKQTFHSPVTRTCPLGGGVEKPSPKAGQSPARVTASTVGHCGNTGSLKSRAPRGSVLPDLADDSQLPEKTQPGFPQ